MTFALCGHAAAGGHRPIAVASDTVHVGAMSIWLGGLVLLLGAVLVGEEREEATPPVLRFSTPGDRRGDRVDRDRDLPDAA